MAIRPRSLGEALNAAGLIRSHVSHAARLLRYLGERAEFDELRSRLQEFDNRVVLEEGRVKEQLFADPV